MELLRKVRAWMTSRPSPYFSMWISGFYLANCMHDARQGNYWLAALSFAVFAWASFDARASLRRLQVTQ